LHSTLLLRIELRRHAQLVAGGNRVEKAIRCTPQAYRRRSPLAAAAVQMNGSLAAPQETRALRNVPRSDGSAWEIRSRVDFTSCLIAIDWGRSVEGDRAATRSPIIHFAGQIGGERNEV
jgi:hypothetical protein